MEMRVAQRTTEWLDEDKINIEYHARQFREPYRSTVAFCDWLETNGLLTPDGTHRILDLGAGAGANTHYMARRYPNSSFVGVDFNSRLVAWGNDFIKSSGVNNCEMQTGDIYNLGETLESSFDGIVSFQTLSWLPEFKAPLDAMVQLQPKWIALTSLFYDGQVSASIEVTEYRDNLEPHRTSPYNVYALPVVQEYLRKSGYAHFLSAPFDIDVDLPKPVKRLMTTYTENVSSGRRLQISGPLLMPWYFVAASR